MRRVAAAWMAACALVTGTAPVQSGDARQAQELEEIVVVGRMPGPPLWKVSKGDHALWIMPLVDMYPRKMEWDSVRVEKLIGESQEYISPPSAFTGINVTNPLVLVRGVGLVTRSTQLPKGRTLADVLPQDLYQRYRKLKSRYFPRNAKIETRTVPEALDTLQDEILEHENLKVLRYGSVYSPEPVMTRLREWLKANKSIRRVSPGAGVNRHLTLKEFNVVAKVMNESLTSPGYAVRAMDCFDKVVAYFERDLEPVKRRANAWATGNIDALLERTPLYVGTRNCAEPPVFMGEGPEAQKLRKDNPALFADLTPDREVLMNAAREQWLAAAETALERNATTFSMLHVDDILDENGLVARLEAKGYTVEISAE